MLTPVPFVVTTVSRLRDRPPRVSTLSFSPCRNPIYPASFQIGIGLCVLSHTHPLVWPYMRFLCVTSGVCRRLPSSCTSQCTTCLKLGLGPISPTTGLAPARTTHMSCARKGTGANVHRFFFGVEPKKKRKGQSSSISRILF